MLKLSSKIKTKATAFEDGSSEPISFVPAVVLKLDNVQHSESDALRHPERVRQLADESKDPFRY